MAKKDYEIVDNIPNTVIKKSPIHGYGLFATEPLNVGDTLCELDGQILDWDFFESLKDQYDNNNDTLFGEWNALSETQLLVRALRTKYSFINHDRQPNLEIRYHPIRLTVIKPIDVSEELTLDYRKEPLRKEYLDGHGKTYL